MNYWWIIGATLVVIVVAAAVMKSDSHVVCPVGFSRTVQAGTPHYNLLNQTHAYSAAIKSANCTKKDGKMECVNCVGKTYPVLTKDNCWGPSAAWEMPTNTTPVPVNGKRQIMGVQPGSLYIASSVTNPKCKK